MGTIAPNHRRPITRGNSQQITEARPGSATISRDARQQHHAEHRRSNRASERVQRHGPATPPRSCFAD